MAKKLGIDLGSSSLGWVIRENNEPIHHGVVRFSTGMVKDKSGGYTSPTRDRRIARSRRRLIQARKYRKRALLKILVEYDLVPLETTELEQWNKYNKGTSRQFPESDLFKKWLACDFTYLNEDLKYKNPYEIRVKALDSKLSQHELGRALYHLVQRRGYKDIGEKDQETKTQIERRDQSGFAEALEQNRTVGEALKQGFLDKNERARNEYPYRAEYEQELIEILKAQGYNTNKKDENSYSDTFVEKVRTAIIWQRPLRSQKGNIGKCTLEPTKPRCPISHPIFEIFRAWQYINTIKTIERVDDERTKLVEIPLEYRELLFKDVFLKQDASFKFEKIKNYLDKLFLAKKTYNYQNKRTKKYDSNVAGMPVCKSLVQIFGDVVTKELPLLHTYNIGTKGHNIVGTYSIYDLWHLIFSTDDDHIEGFAIRKLNIPTSTRINKNGEEVSENPIVKLKASSFASNYSNLSLKAMCKIIPFLQEGHLYDEAVLLAKLPESIDSWTEKKGQIIDILTAAKKTYTDQKDLIYITNSLIDKYKSLTNDEVFAYKDYEYKLTDKEEKAVDLACASFYGEKTWKNKEDKQKISDAVLELYQAFFWDTNREFRKAPTLSSIVHKALAAENIELKGQLYHHSDRGNLYPKPIFNSKLEKELLAVPLIDSIKNPMFNKAMSILRRLINELLVKEYKGEDGVIQSYIDENTEIIIEVARELNDNNKRAAIERYQRERRLEREKYREFIRELKGEDEKSIEEDIKKLSLWAEQLPAPPRDPKKHLSKNHEILSEKKAIRRYELWTEQKGQCMYTGKPISIAQLFSSEIQVEHTIPRSLLPDNTLANQTVCYTKYNNDIKNNRIPTECPNYNEEKDLPQIGSCTAIEPRLKRWIELKEHYYDLKTKHAKAFGNENEEEKNTRIQRKHYYQMHYEYWKDKVERFTTEEIKESWVRRQLTDTQMVSKYAREYLKTYFKKVLVQKGSVTADFRKIFGFQETEKKDRSKHTHHSIDAAVLTLIPTNSSKRVKMLEQLYREEEMGLRPTQKIPDGFRSFNAQELISKIENKTLVVNYEKDKITQPTYRNVRKRGKLQYLKDENGAFKQDENGDKILLKAKGSSIRGNLFQDTYIGKIKLPEKDEHGKPLRNDDGSWRYNEGANEYTYTVRKPIADAKPEDIIDPVIHELVTKADDIRKVKDPQGNIIRHVRVKTGAGRNVKIRNTYKSKHEYKNSFYSAAGKIPYAIFITNLNNGRIDRKMLPVPMHEIAQVFKEHHRFTPELYLKRFHPEHIGGQDIKLLKLGQKVFVLKEDSDYEKRKDTTFQMNRMYRITQFFDNGKGGMYLKHHLEATEDGDIDKKVKENKHLYLKRYDDKFDLEEIVENESIEDIRERRKDLEDRKYKFSSLKDYRFKRLLPFLSENELKEIKKEMGKYKKQSSVIEIEGETPLLKISAKDCNFLYENYDFTIDITGDLDWPVL